MLTDICQEIRNWFDVERKFGTFTIDDGHITVDGLQEGQYFRIVGSVFNDGVHLSSDTLINETFKGSVWLLAIPKSVIDLAEEISTWETEYGSKATSPYNSESFGGYSRTMGNGGGSSSVPTWTSIFADKLNRWRKVHA